VIEAEGSVHALDELARRIAASPPPRAIIEGLDVEHALARGLEAFSIGESEALPPVSARVSPDLATCPKCLRGDVEPADRRFRYPFINCTDCGPRYSIARDVPYDRARTTMSGFSMCRPCAAEYGDPDSRRFHAQPNACSTCGPHIFVAPAAGGAPLEEALAALRRGAIVAVKGLGGFHLACDARDAVAVRRLRERKRRSEKPFAVMFPDVAGVERTILLALARLAGTADVFLLRDRHILLRRGAREPGAAVPRPPCPRRPRPPSRVPQHVDRAAGRSPGARRAAPPRPRRFVPGRQHLVAAGLPTARLQNAARGTVEAMIRDGINVVPTSSAGRLFDAVASLAGIRDVTSYEGQAAMELEAISETGAEGYPLPVTGEGLLEIDPRPLVCATGSTA
jgi:hydrogenase maturation factor HypF (carbamoyltransferase family)